MTFLTDHFGRISVEESSVVEFPEGLPGFEDRRRFVPLQDPRQAGLVYLQSLDAAGLCFLALPVLGLRPGYELALREEDRLTLGLPDEAAPAIGRDVAALAILSVAEGEDPTVNLRAPIVIHIATRRAVQAIRPDDRYGCQEPLVEKLEAVCS